MTQADQIWILAEGYIAHTLPEEEYASLSRRLENDPVFASTFMECTNLLRSLEGKAGHKNMQRTIQNIHQEIEEQDAADTTIIKRRGRIVPFYAKYRRIAAVAACAALISTITTYYAVHKAGKKEDVEYGTIRKELETIRISQQQLRQAINKKPLPPPSDVKFTGTGFALTNDGFIVTNYHVINGGDSIYMEDHQGQYFKTYLVAFDQKSDLAILKVEKESFRFGHHEVPYTFATLKAGLAARVFTIGYPDDDIIYTEGYISSRNGFKGDSMQYRLELPADPGQSGSPVVDEHGNILAVLTAKGNRSQGNSYAVSTKALLQLVQSIGSTENIRLPKTNMLARLPRDKQVEQLEIYTCSIKVL